jgi:hypothetical protein
MESWYSLNLGDGIMAGTPSAEIEELFVQRFSAAGKPPEMAVFTRSESEGRLHCEVIAYFSPAAAGIASAFDAEPCEKPLKLGLGLLAGDPGCWPVLFPEWNSPMVLYIFHAKGKNIMSSTGKKDKGNKEQRKKSKLNPKEKKKIKNEKKKNKFLPGWFWILRLYSGR